ncbi:MAG: D-alanine--D-alanine ligase [Kiritimatiellia bacterium]
MGRFKKVAVLMGGPSSEREISIRSGIAVAAGLRAAGYTVEPVLLDDRNVELPACVEAVFIALHGEFGEDGQLQSILRDRGIPYTGSDPEASAVSFDKRRCKVVLERAGIPTPAWEVVRAGGYPRLLPPLVTKPPRQGSSIGIVHARTPQEVGPALAESLKYDSEVLVEAFIPGRELTISFVDGEALPIIEIAPDGGFYGFSQKYTKGQTEYRVPAPLPPDQAARSTAAAVATWEALGCRGLGRVDIRMNPEGALFVLEMNTIPGFTETSLLPKAAAAAGIGFEALCARIMETAGL